MATWPSGLGKGLQSPVLGFDSQRRLSLFLLRKLSTMDRDFRGRILLSMILR